MTPAQVKAKIWMSAAKGAVLPIATLMVVLFMMVPVPAIMLDIGFITNIMISLAVLMVALNAAKPLDFSSFPTVLLFATLLRLALNVASTRVVLVQGHEGSDAAGQVIEAFGHFLIGGDYVVGIFVFAILMIINLVVITKGAGRVSEVSARFTLDALPGKQMAIDADLNAGLITPDDAKKRRVEVATEADFYGSMDGSSKFVKGDAVAGLLNLAANIVGGLILGPVSHGLAIGKAAQGLQLSLMVALIGLSAPLGQRIGSRLGLEKAMTAALVVLSAGGLLRLAADSFPLLLGSSLLTGIGMGAAGVLVPGLVARHLPGLVGLATGMFAVGMGLGVAIAAALTLPVTDLLGGWRPALALWGVVAAATAATWAVVVPADGEGPGARVPHGLPWRSRTAWLVVGFSTAAMAAGFTGTTWLSAVLLEHGLGEERAAAFYVLFQLAGVVSMLGLPAVTDRIADLRTLMASALVSQGIGMTLLVAAPAVAAPVAAFLLGLGMGGGTSLTLVLVTRTTRSASEAACSASRSSRSRVGCTSRRLRSTARVCDGCRGPVTPQRHPRSATRRRGSCSRRCTAPRRSPPSAAPASSRRARP